MPVYIVGNGAHGQDIYRQYVPYGEVYLVDDDPGRCRDRWPQTPVQFVVGVNNPTTRRAIADRLEAEGWKPYDDGVWISSLAILAPTVTLERHAHVNGGVFAVRCKIGAYTTVAPGVTICGDVAIGEEVFIGAGATISNLVTIEDRAVIGAGAVVLPGTTVGAGETWVGVPAKPR